MSNNNNDRNLLVIKASAGSGKTYNLALQYIKHLLFTTRNGKLVPRRDSDRGKRPLNAHRQLLAITFTNKATDEMKRRIVAELYSLSRPECESKYLKGFMSESSLDENKVRRLAGLALDELLFDYSNFNVSTIDSFFQSILRNFARELDRDFNYDIQLEEDYAVRVAVHNFLLSLGKDGQPTDVDQWVKDYQAHMVHGNADKRRWKFFDDGGELSDFAKQINNELFRSKMKDIRDYLGKMENNSFKPDFKKIRQFVSTMADVVKKCEDELTITIQQLSDALQPLSDDLWKGRSFSSFMANGGTDPLPKKSWEIVDDNKIRNQFGKNKPDAATIALLQDIVNRQLKLGEMLSFFKHIRDNLGLLGLLAMIDVFLEEYRHESNSILIGDTNELIGAVIESGSEFVYERVGTAISHFMIDEFQDTSAKQYANFKSLLEESLANNHFNMLIGDAKQSIYRFRNADPSVFREKVGTDFAANIYDGRTPVSSSPNKPSSINYRSSENIILFNNSLFQFMRMLFQDRSTVVDTYEDVEQGMPDDIKTDKVPGYVRLLTGNYKSLISDDVIRSSLPPGFSADGDIDVLTVLPGYLLKLHERYDWRSIGILVNKNKEGDKIVDCILNFNKRTTGEKIRIISGESLLLNNSPIIRRIIAMLRFIDISQFGVDEDDDADQDKEKKALWRKRQSDSRLYTALSAFIKDVAAHPELSAQDNGSMLARSLESVAQGSANDNENSGDTGSSTLLKQLLPSAGELTSLVSIVETIISHFKNDEQCKADVDNEMAFLLAFQDAVMQFSAMRNGGSVREFLKFWDEKKGTLAVSSSPNDDAIEIMSIHKAKGLEFDCVVIPFADWELDSNSRETDYWMPDKAFVDVMKSLGMEPVDPAIVPPMLHVDKASTIALYERGSLGTVSAEFVRTQVDDVLIDNLNKTYVAMTRPRSELHVFASGKDSTVAGPLAKFARTGVMTPMMLEPSWYEMGTPPARADFEALREKKKQEEKGKSKCDKPQVEYVPINEYEVHAIPRGLSVRTEYASSASIDAGIRMHSLMSRIHDRDDVDRVINQGIKHGIITQNPDDPCSVENLDRHVRGPIMNPDTIVAQWFDSANKVYSERTITTASDSLFASDGIENLRPDRIIRCPNNSLLVIDYKSGERRDKHYCRQVQNYINKLRLIFPNTPIAGRIWYILDDTVIDETGQELPFQQG